ncbi:hypothetical protein BU15DRAFT_62010 [Melanogaster broomeanus]|nr:hypothetical protein BU15DRAFT_62010 [Melanogaster broomeanus]
MASEESITRPLVSIASLIIHVHDSTARVAAALDALSRIQNLAVAFSACQLQALGPPKAPTAPHHRVEVQAQSEAAVNSSQSHPYPPYYRLRDRTPTDQASSAPSVATGSSVRSNTIDEYPPKIQALPVIPSFGGSALVVGTTPLASSCTLPVVHIFGGGTHAEHVDATSMLPSAPLVPTSTVDPRPTETQAPTPSQGEGAPAADAMTPCIPCTPPAVRISGGGTHAEHVDAASMLSSTPPVPTSTVDGEGAPTADAMTPYTPHTLPVVRVLGGSIHAEGVDTTLTLPVTSPVAHDIPYKWSRGWSRDIRPGPSRRVNSRSSSPRRTPLEISHSNLNTSDEGHLPPAIPPDVDMADNTEFQPSAPPTVSSPAGLGAGIVPPQPLPLPLSLPLSEQLKSMIDRLVTERLNKATIQIVEPTVKLVIETCIKCITDSIGSAQGGSVQVWNGVRVSDRDNTELEQSDLDGDNLDGDDDTPSKSILITDLSQDAFRKYLEEKGLKKCRGDSMLPKSALPDSVRGFNATNDNPPTLSYLMINWSSTLTSPGWNTEVIHLLTMDFQQKLQNGTYPFIVFNKDKMSLSELHKLCIEKLRQTHCEKQDRIKLAMTAITAWKERCHKLNRMTTRKHGPKVVRHVALLWLSPVISELFDCVESYNTALHKEHMTVHTGNSSLQHIFEPRHTDMKVVALDRLPRNWYDEEWYKARSASGHAMLSIRKDVPIPTLN